MTHICISIPGHYLFQIMTVQCQAIMSYTVLFPARSIVTSFSEILIQIPIVFLGRKCNWDTIVCRMFYIFLGLKVLTHWGRVTHICVSELTIIGSDNGLSPGQRQVIIWTNAGIMLIGALGTNLSEILMEIYTFSFKKMHLKMSSGKWRPFCHGLNVLIAQDRNIPSVSAMEIPHSCTKTSKLLSTLIQVMAWCLNGTKQFPEPMITNAHRFESSSPRTQFSSELLWLQQNDKVQE